MNQSPKIIVLTGASRGLGRAMLEEFLNRGHTVAACARSKITANAKSSNPKFFASLDVCNVSEVNSWAQSIISELGPPDLLINNAALINRSAPLWELTPEEFNPVIDVNIKGVFNSIRAFAPAMIGRKQGVIVNFSSGWGRSTSPQVAPYCATKWAIEGLTQSLAQELPPGMAAVALNPGVIDTEMLRSCFGNGAGSYPKPAAWAKGAVPFLLTLAPGHNGQSLTVPGAPVD
jgi:NAD(P)-dependent dehydrogenase (short-subunit alcohol dehydrogenase family)